VELTSRTGPADDARLGTLPDSVLLYARALTALAEQHYGAALHGVYLHGSAAFGHFVARSSDLDVLIVIGETEACPESFFEAVRDTPRPDELLALECSVLDRADLAAAGLHRPFRFHFTLDDKRQRFVSGAGYDDPDLVLHFAVCGQAGLALKGPPPRETFPMPHRSVVLQALARELEWALADGDLVYAALNGARAWRYAVDCALSSKLGGWLWARSRVAEPEFLDRALSAYLAGRAEHRVPVPAMPGFDRWVRDMLREVLSRIRAAAAAGSVAAS
jgi:streptomycin 3"-adenylyltransferase